MDRGASDSPEARSTEEGSGSVKRRSRAGCLTCRRRRVKCDEVHPQCGKCQERATLCEWPTAKSASQHKYPRTTRSCESCRTRKTKCERVNGTSGPCTSCVDYGSICRWPQVNETTLSTHAGTNEVSSSSSQLPVRASSSSSFLGFQNPIGSSSRPLPLPNHFEHPTNVAKSELTGFASDERSLIVELVHLYFATVHYFGFLTFIHEPDYWDRFENGTIPDTLTLLMAANALRFGGRPADVERLDLADKWAAEAGQSVMVQAMVEFGAMELMEVVLYHHYEFLCGRYSRGWVLAGMAVRMMTFLRLHMFDESPHLSVKPMLGAESLRRLAWSVYFLDATMDGGQYGFTALPDGSFTIPLPCDERPFLRHQTPPKEYMLPSVPGPVNPDLGLAGYLLRAMYARQILAGLHSRIQRDLVPISAIPDCVKQAERDVRQLLGSLPPDMTDSRINFHIWKSQQTLFFHVHVLRNTCYRHMALLKILSAPFLMLGPGDISILREQLVNDASSLSALFSLGLDRGVVMDPQMAMHAYNGLEILLYQPLRRQPQQQDVQPSRTTISTLLLPFLSVIRQVAGVSELVSLLYPEAVNRMVRVGFTEHLSDDDTLALLKRVHRLANPDSEFDFHDSFWRYEVAVSRHQSEDQVVVSPNDILLEVEHIKRQGENRAERPDGSSLSRFQAVFGPSRQTSVERPSQEQAFAAGEGVGVTYGLPMENLETLMGATQPSEQIGIAFNWSLNGIDL